ncbi:MULTISPECIES: hypothetical protein [unclassified Streptomyces]
MAREQGLAPGGQSTPPRTDLPLPNCELLGQVPQVLLDRSIEDG